MTEPTDRKRIKALVRAVDKARDFPVNTCAASRHTEQIGEALAKRRLYMMLAEEPAHCGESILATVKALYEARTEIKRLEKLLEAKHD